MCMLTTFVYVEIVEELITQLILGEHTLYYFAEETIRPLLLEITGAKLALTTGVATKLKVDAIFPFLAREHNLFGIDDDNVVATIYVWSEAGFVLTTKKLRYFGAQTTQALSIGVHNHPFLGCSCLVHRYCLVTYRVHFFFYLQLCYLLLLFWLNTMRLIASTIVTHYLAI